jgi:hypothetical protein
LEKLDSRSKRKIFEWEIKDTSLRISGNDEKWDLHFTSLTTGLIASVLLSEEETKKIKDALFSHLKNYLDRPEFTQGASRDLNIQK